MKIQHWNVHLIRRDFDVEITISGIAAHDVKHAEGEAKSLMQNPEQWYVVLTTLRSDGSCI